MSYLVDANVLSEVTRPQADTGVVDWLDQHDTELHVSVITLGEIYKGIRLLASGPKQQRLTRWLAELEASFEERILPVDQAVMREWATLYARHQKAGRLFSSFDSLVAATAVRHELTVVTRDQSDFPPEIPLLNPWNQAE